MSLLFRFSIILLLFFSVPEIGICQSQKTENKPYKILTNGQRITIQASSRFHSLIVWTSGGHRITEQKNIKTDRFSFQVPAGEKIIFLLIIFSDEKRFTEKIGIR